MSYETATEYLKKAVFEGNISSFYATIRHYIVDMVSYLANVDKLLALYQEAHRCKPTLCCKPNPNHW